MGDIITLVLIRCAHEQVKLNDCDNFSNTILSPLTRQLRGKFAVVYYLSFSLVVFLLCSLSILEKKWVYDFLFLTSSLTHLQGTTALRKSTILRAWSI